MLLQVFVEEGEVGLILWHCCSHALGGMHIVLHCPPCGAEGGICCVNKEVSHPWSGNEAQEKQNHIKLLVSPRCGEGSSAPC